MDVRRDLQRTYREAFERSGDTAIAYLEAASRFQDVAGYLPDRPLLNRLLQGAMLGDDHPLMKLLSKPHPRRRAADSGLSVGGLKPTAR